MKNIVIAAGYATRLGELTKNFPKPLLQIGETTILGRMLDDIDRIPEIDEHIIITNHRFAEIFEDWASAQTYSKPVTIVDDGTSTNETRLGAVCDLLFALDKLSIDDDLLVVAADNILMFSFQEFVDFAKEKGCVTVGITSNADSPLAKNADIAIFTDTGAEIITGSTRLKAGTAQKLVLNILSTAAMVKTGKVYENLMINLRPTNVKLRERVISIVCEIKKIDRESAVELLEANEWNIRKAVG